MSTVSQRIPLRGHAVNLLPRDARELSMFADALGDRILAAVIVRDLSDNAAVERAHAWSSRGVQVSVGLGDGDDRQWRRALAVALETPVAHLNQPWFSAGRAVGALRAGGQSTVVNALVSPVDSECGRVTLAPGRAPVTLAWDALIDNLRELDIPSIKFFPMHGEEGHAAFSGLVRRLSRLEGPRIVEPSGGVESRHLSWLFAEGSDAGVRVIPHMYGAMRTPTGEICPRALDGVQAALSASL